MRYSIIIPIYNAEQYIKYAINSIINQTIGFTENIELILVNDGSTDKSEEICLNYKNSFPKNIKYLFTKNSGPGNARNKGIESVSKDTEYIGFLDADDYLSIDTLEEVDSFFKKNEDIKLGVIPLFHFDKINTPHRLNYRFTHGNRVIDIKNDYKAIHFHIGGCFFKSECFLKNDNFRFQKLSFWEDALLINTFLLENRKYGVISEAKYYYRKRINEDSLVNGSWYRKDRYIPLLNKCYKTLIEISKKNYNEIIPYIQYLIIYHMRLYLFPKYNSIIFTVLNKKEQEIFFNNYVSLIQQFDEKYILEQNMPYYYKNYLVHIKKFGWPYKDISEKVKVIDGNIIITKINFKFKYWYVEGQLKSKNYLLTESDKIIINNRKNKLLTNKILLPSKKIIIWGTKVQDHTYSGFSVKIPISIVNLQFSIETKNKEIFILNKVNLFLFYIKKLIKNIYRFVLYKKDRG